MAMNRRLTRTTRVLAAGGLVVGSLALATAVRASVAPCNTGGITPVANGWLRIAAPHFSTAGKLRAFAVARSTADRIYATNGTEVTRSTDSGCTWKSVFTTPTAPTAATPFSAATAAITSIVTTRSTRVYLVVADTIHPHVVVSEDGGTSWHTSDNGLVDSSGATQPPALVAADSPGTLYLLTHGASAAGVGTGTDLLFASTDDGASWAPRVLAAGGLLSSTSAPSFHGMSVDPANPDALWAGTSSGLLRSPDGGQSWNSVAIGGSDGMTVVHVAHDVGGKARVLVFEDGRSTGYTSADNGSSWTALDVPAPVESATTGADARDATIAAGGKLYQLARNALVWTPMSNGLPPLVDVTSDGVRGSSVYACSCGGSNPAIYRHASLAAPRVDEYKQGAVRYPPPVKNSGVCMPNAAPAPTAPQRGDPRLNPASSQVVLAPGSSRKVHYQFVQPPKEMDIFLATTTGPKSEFSHCPFKYGAVAMLNALVKERNVRAGFADYGDYPNFTDLNPLDAIFPSSSNGFVYKLQRRLGQVDQHLYNQISAQGNYQEGSGPPGDKANLAVLFQAATGLGQVVGPPAVPTYKIAGGLQAGFNDYAYKVIVDVAGSFFNTSARTTGYPGPDFAPVEKVLKARGIHQVGIWINNRLNKADASNEGYPGRNDLIAVARATGAISPKQIDCDGDGFVDVKPGDPLVCTYIAPAEGDFESHDPTMGVEMRRILETMHDPQPVRLAPLLGASSVSLVSPRVYPGIDALLGHTFGFDVTFHCGAKDINQTKEVRLGASVGTQLLAQATATLVCGAPVVPVVHHPAALPPLPPPPVPPAPVTGPAPNPVVNPAPNPAPNPAQAPQAQPQPVAHPAAVPQMQEQPQLALQRASKELQADEPMSALTDGAPADAWAVPRRLVSYGGVFLLVCSAGLARRLAFARDRARSRRS
jgi:hypothetical protein